MYGGMVSSHSSTARQSSSLKRRVNMHESRHPPPQQPPPPVSTSTESTTSVYRRLIALIRQAWTGVKFALDSDFEGEVENVRRTRPRGLEALCRSTRFSRRELQLLYRGFKQECPTGQVSEHELRSIYARFFPQGAEASHYARYVFQTFDHERSGEITFEEFAAGLSLLLRGTFHERLRWAFNLYDLNGDGVITREELLDIVASVYGLLGPGARPPADDLTVRDHVDRVFQKLDLNKDGVVTIDEFVEFCSKDEDVTKSLTVFDTLW